MSNTQKKEVEATGSTADFQEQVETVKPVEVETPKKRTTPAKVKTVEEVTPIVVAPDLTPAAETPDVVPVAPVEEIAPVVAAPDVAPALPVKTGFTWGSKRNLETSKNDVNVKIEISITNTGNHSFEAYTRTALPSGKTTIIRCESMRQRSAIIDKLTKLNQLTGTERYVIEG